MADGLFNVGVFLGFNDLWGYQVYIAGKDNHAGHSDCYQINSKVHQFSFCVCGHCADNVIFSSYP